MAQDNRRRLLPHMTNSKIMNAIVFVVIASIPLLYSGLFSSAYQDPVARIDHVKAAVVNEDKQVTVTQQNGESTTYNLGNDLAEKLTHPDKGQEVGFTWEAMTFDEAQEALSSGDIRAYMRIPGDFSQTAGDLGSDRAADIEKVTLDIVSDDSISYLAGTLSRTVAATLQGSLSAQVSQEYISNVLLSLGTLHDGMTEAADGGKQLADGSADLSEGLVTLEDALGTARGGAGQLGSGAWQLSQGTNALAKGSTDLARGADALSQGTSALNNAIPSLASGTSELTSGGSKLHDGAQELASGSQGLHSGVAAYTEGADSVATGLEGLQSSTPALVEGTQKLTSGAESLSAGINDYSTKTGAFAAKMGELDTAAEAFSGKLTQVSDGLSALAENCEASGGTPAYCAQLQGAVSNQAALSAKGAELAGSVKQLGGHAQALSAATEPIGSGAQSLVQGAKDLSGKIGSIDDTQADKTLVGAINSLHSGTQALTKNSESLRSGAEAVADGATTLSSGSKALSSGLKKLDAKVPTLASSVTQLDDGASKVAAGASDLSGGAHQVDDGAHKLATGAQDLGAGLVQIADGAGEAKEGAAKLDEGTNNLADALTDAKDKVPAYSDNDSEHIAAHAAALTDVTAVRANEVSNAAGGFTPMFLSLSLWIGGIALFMVMPALDRRHSSKEKWWLSAARPLSIAAGLGLVQAALSVLMLNWLIEIHAVHVMGWIAIAALTALTFIAINQACIALLSYRGRFVSLILLLLQITSMGGTFPVETAPKFFQWLHPYLPMTWVHYSFRAVIAGGGLNDVYSHTVKVLCAWLVVSLLIVFVSAKVRAGKRPLHHDNANSGDMIDESHAPFGSEPLPVDAMVDNNAVDSTIDAMFAPKRS